MPRICSSLSRGWATGVAVATHAITKDPSPFAGFVLCDHSPRFYSAPDWPHSVTGGALPAWGSGVPPCSAGREPTGSRRCGRRLDQHDQPYECLGEAYPASR
jgi:hypothetical protein